MKKIRKGKKMLLIILAVIIFIVAAVLIVSVVKDQQDEKPSTGEEQIIIPLPETTYSDMQVKNIEMEYLKNNNETMVTMEIHNTTTNTVENENLDAMLIGANENVIGKIQTYIKKLNPGEQYDISVILKGDLTAATQIKLVKK